MTDQPVTTIRAKIDSERYALFASADDCLLFIANFSKFPMFAALYFKIRGTMKDASHQFRSYREASQNAALYQVMSNTQLTDGMSLLEAMKGKLEL